ncbi:uncharacterized protein F4807DRAFT_413990 [Annulohypoxylon truncatum]|uniref:uncharacterized protein n=1 Tax=Annulohypoxylon truncatum TaxID=327061 RepID=UPI002007F394|nr:uncharacterized protein F4807DRAFT_413990 [Annulohypoxylon truncatum]KAI1212672.1 hypothetical protein F4807DRAFT_413990 [Annulohypoxylon truncatum]
MPTTPARDISKTFQYFSLVFPFWIHFTHCACATNKTGLPGKEIQHRFHDHCQKDTLPRIPVGTHHSGILWIGQQISLRI